MYEIRLAEYENANAIISLLNDVTLYLHNKKINQWAYPWDFCEIEKDIKNRQAYILLQNSQVIGVFFLGAPASCLSIPMMKPSDLYLYRIAVLPEYQGKDIGLIITNYAFKASRALGKPIYLDCWAGNEKLKSFYTRAGFDYCGDFPEEDYMISVFKYE